MDSLRRDFLSLQDFLQKNIEMEISLLKDMLSFYRNLDAEEKKMVDLKRCRKIINALKMIRAERKIQIKIFIFLLKRIESRETLDEDPLENVKLSEFPTICELYVLRDQLRNIIEQINLERILYKKPRTYYGYQKQRERNPAKNVVATLDDEDHLASG